MCQAGQQGPTEGISQGACHEGARAPAGTAGHQEGISVHGRRAEEGEVGSVGKRPEQSPRGGDNWDGS